MSNSIQLLIEELQSLTGSRNSKIQAIIIALNQQAILGVDVTPMLVSFLNAVSNPGDIARIAAMQNSVGYFGVTIKKGVSPAVVSKKDRRNDALRAHARIIGVSIPEGEPVPDGVKESFSDSLTMPSWHKWAKEAKEETTSEKPSLLVKFAALLENSRKAGDKWRDQDLAPLLKVVQDVADSGCLAVGNSSECLRDKGNFRAYALTLTDAELQEVFEVQENHVSLRDEYGELIAKARNEAAAGAGARILALEEAAGAREKEVAKLRKRLKDAEDQVLVAQAEAGLI